MTARHQDGSAYPDCVVRLVGVDGNAFAILSAVRRALTAHLEQDERITGPMRTAIINTFIQEAMSGDYDNLLRTCAEWVTIE